jgi:Spy/CpxP family protein refolding chaperone
MFALFVTSAVVMVEAQQPRLGGTGLDYFNLHISVLNNKSLQEELKITDAQKEKFHESSKKLAELNKKLVQAFKGAGGNKDKLKEAFAENTKESEKVNEAIKKVVMDTLSPDQAKRYKQIGYQVKGIYAYSDKEIAQELKLTEAQSSKIKGIMEGYAKDSKELNGFGGGGKGFDKEKFAEVQKKREKLIENVTTEIDNALTGDQKQQWKEMTGAPFDTTNLIPGFGGGFGGRNGNNKTKN